MSWWKKVTNFLQWSVSNDTKVVEVVLRQRNQKKWKPSELVTKKDVTVADDLSTPDVNEAYVKRKKKK